MDNKSLKLVELSTKIDAISKDLTAEELKHKEALAKNASPDILQEIKDRILFIQRKLALYKQAEQMRYRNLHNM